jgi:hypothetical protein
MGMSLSRIGPSGHQSDAPSLGGVGRGVECYRLTALRGILIAVLAFFVVLQSSWALTASYCQHERTIASAHFGHHQHDHEHDHPHEAQTVAASGDTGDAAAAQAQADVDPDCSACHACSPAIVLTMAQALLDPRQSERFTPASTASPATLPASIERPNWPALA